MKWFRRLSIKGKLILITLAASLASVIVACTLFIVYDIDNFRRAMKEDLRVVAEGIAINSTPALEFESLDSARDILGALRADPHIEMAVIYDRKGNSVDYRRADLAPSTVPALSRKEGGYFEDGKLRISRGTVLVIDDDPNACDLMMRALAREGFRVLVANNGPEGLKMAREAHPNVITLDVLMPGMDGWAVIKALKADPELGRRIPVVVVTAKDITPQDQMRLEGNVRKIFHKATYTREELVGEIRSAMEAPSPRAAAG